MLPARRRIPFFPRFPTNEYSQSSDAVKRVNDAALDYLEALQKELEDVEKLMQEKAVGTATLQRQIEKMDNTNIVLSLLLVIATTMFGFGVNLATSSPYYWLGWVLSFAGSGLQLLVILIGVLARLRGRN